MKTPFSFSRKREDGVALVITIILLAILIAVVAQLAFLTKTEVRVSRSYKASLQNRAATDNAINRARKHLMIDSGRKRTWDHPEEYWARPFAPRLSAGVQVRFRIRDEERNLNLNKLVTDTEDGPRVQKVYRNQARRLFEQLHLDAILLDRLITYLKTGGTGPNRGNTNQRGGPRTLTSRKQLLRIDGFTTDVLFGTKRTEPLARYVTLRSTGKININTAPVYVLVTLAEAMTDTIAQDIVDYRSSVDEDGRKRYFQQPAGLFQVSSIRNNAILKEQLFQNQNLMTVRSTHFSVYSIAKSENVTQTSRTVLRRDDEEPEPKTIWHNRNAEMKHLELFDREK